MSIILLVPLLVCLLGVLVYALASNPKLVEIGRLAYFAGLLVTLLVTAQHLIRF